MTSQGTSPTHHLRFDESPILVLLSKALGSIAWLDEKKASRFGFSRWETRRSSRCKIETVGDTGMGGRYLSRGELLERAGVLLVCSLTAYLKAKLSIVAVELCEVVRLALAHLA